jgi:SH3 domain-containing protein
MAVRVAQVAVPTLVVSLLGVGVAAATWPGDQTRTAYPAPAIDRPAQLIPIPTRVRGPELRRTSTPSPTAKPSPTRPQAKPSPKAKLTSKPVAARKHNPVPTPALKVVGSKYATTSLNVRTAPDRSSDVVAVVSAGTKLSVTAAVHNGFRYISYSGRGRWIGNRYLSSDKPKTSSTSRSSGGSGSGSSGGISTAPCPGDSAVESGLTQDAIRVHRALCARYPQISSFGGRRASSGFHGTGQAVDAMISDSSVGWDIANWTRANASKLGVSEVIYYQKIWTVQRSSDGWRPMSDRGSATANHYDHVHVSVYGNRGTV